MSMMDLQSISAGIGLFRSLLGSVKDLKEILPKGPQKEQFEITLANAERQTALIESQLALLLGYKLCKCEFPPHPMLKSGTIDGTKNFRCPKCGADSVSQDRPTKAITDYDVFNY